MKNTFIAPDSIEKMLEELENYVPIGAIDDSLEPTVAKHIMITDGKSSAYNITAPNAFDLINSSYLRTVV